MTLAVMFSSREAWARLAALRMPPHTAYRVLKYAKLVQAEYDVIEQQRGKLIREAAGAKEGEDVSLKSGTPEYAAFVSEFVAMLETDSDLKPCDMKLAALLDVLGKDQGNTLSAQDLGQLEPFFPEG